MEILSVGKKNFFAIVFVNKEFLLNTHGKKANQVQIESDRPWQNLETVLQKPFEKGEKQWKVILLIIENVEYIHICNMLDHFFCKIDFLEHLSIESKRRVTVKQ